MKFGWRKFQRKLCGEIFAGETKQKFRRQQSSNGEYQLPFLGRKFALRIITNTNGLTKATCTKENKYSTLKNPFWILILLKIILIFLERLLNMGWGLYMYALCMICKKNECMSLLVYEFVGINPWFHEFWSGGLHRTMEVSFLSMSLRETCCISKWLPKIYSFLKRLALGRLLFGRISLMLSFDLQIKLCF